MKLYFLRHGLADRNAWRGSDFERPLTQRGKMRMARQAVSIGRMNLGLDVILTSPLRRARQTAEIVADVLDLQTRLKVEERLGFGFDCASLAEIIATHVRASALMLVGHEPTFSETISELVGGCDLVCKKGSLARVDLLPGDDLRGELLWLIPPKALAK